MSYAVIPQKNPILDEASSPSDRKKAATGAAIFTLLLILCIFLRFFSKLDPIPEPKGLVAAFDNIEIEEAGGGGGGGAESNEKQSNQNNSSSKSKEIETNDDVKSEVSINKGNDKDAEVKTDPGLDFTNFSAEDKTKTEGNKENGPLGPVGPGKGDGKGFGEGSEEGNGSGLCIRNCECYNSKWDIDVVEVTAWITVDINEDGTVSAARFAQTGDVNNGKNYTVINTNIKSQKNSTQKIVLDCYSNRVYKSKGKKYRITQKLVLKKF
jgi:hypothetical protein